MQQQNTQKVEASKVPEYIKKAAKKAAEFNSNLNRERMEERRAYFDLQTHVGSLMFTSPWTSVACGRGLFSASVAVFCTSSVSSSPWSEAVVSVCLVFASHLCVWCVPCFVVDMLLKGSGSWIASCVLGWTEEVSTVAHALLTLTTGGETGTVSVSQTRQLSSKGFLSSPYVVSRDTAFP